MLSNCNEVYEVNQWSVWQCGLKINRSEPVEARAGARERAGAQMGAREVAQMGARRPPGCSPRGSRCPAAGAEGGAHTATQTHTPTYTLLCFANYSNQHMVLILK